MTNETFLLLSAEERQSKFRAVLNSKTDGCLSGEELRDILLTISSDRQYEVSVYWDAGKFCRSLALSEDSRGRTILGQVMAGHGQAPGKLFCETQAAAVLVRKQADEGMLNQLHIFIPPERLQKGYQRG